MMTRRLALAGALAALSVPAAALPQYPRLFNAKYRYRPACALCHVPDNWDLTRYGVEFFKKGRDAESLAGIEAMDPDRDGFASLEEILARANPGDPASTPKAPGKWLAKPSEVVPPRKHLRALFPSATSFRYGEAELDASAAARVGRRLGRPLRGEESLPAFFEALEDERPLGEALYASNAGKPPCFFLVGYARSSPGTPRAVAGLRMLSCSLRELREEEFLGQFSGKSAGELDRVRSPRPEYEPVVRAMVEAARAGAEVLKEARP